jgi:hypothetical protein
MHVMHEVVNLLVRTLTGHYLNVTEDIWLSNFTCTDDGRTAVVSSGCKEKDYM